MNWKGFGNGHGLTEILSDIYLEGLRKTLKSSARIVDVLAEIQTKHLPNESLERYCYAISLVVTMYC
jgi:hypothetical protein